MSDYYTVRGMATSSAYLLCLQPQYSLTQLLMVAVHTGDLLYKFLMFLAISLVLNEFKMALHLAFYIICMLQV